MTKISMPIVHREFSGEEVHAVKKAVDWAIRNILANPNALTKEHREWFLTHLENAQEKLEAAYEHP